MNSKNLCEFISSLLVKGKSLMVRNSNLLFEKSIIRLVRFPDDEKIYDSKTAMGDLNPYLKDEDLMD